MLVRRNMQINCLHELAKARMVVAEKEDAMMRLEADSTHALSHQYEKHAHKQHALFHEFDKAIRDKDALQREQRADEPQGTHLLDF